METNFDERVKQLYTKAKALVDIHRSMAAKIGDGINNTPAEFKRKFFELIDQVNLKLLEDKDNFYGYFLFQMAREIRFDIGGPTAVNFRDAGYVMCFNPIIFLKLDRKQMETTIKHEILHVVSLHLIRAGSFKKHYSVSAINMAMDIVVNKYLKYLPPYATTLEWVNLRYGLKLKPYETFEAYLEKIQKAMDSLEPEEKSDQTPEEAEENRDNKEKVETEYSIEKTHDLWEQSDEIGEKTLQEFTWKVIGHIEKEGIPSYLGDLIAELENSKGELPWNLYLKRLMGTLEGDIKKTVTRRNRRQPERLELRGQLRDHKAKVVVALDVSGSITQEEFKQAMKEVLTIVRNYHHEITVIECDDEIRSVYKVKSEKDLRDRNPKRGGTSFEPVLEYTNRSGANLLVYFTDGKGEDKLRVIPEGYKILWIISGRGDKLSLKEPYGVVKKLKQLNVVDNSPDFSEGPRSGFSMMNQEK